MTRFCSYETKEDKTSLILSEEGLFLRKKDLPNYFVDGVINMSSYSITDSIWEFIRQYKSDLWLYVFLSIADPIGDVILPHFYGKIVDNLSHYPRKDAFSCNKTTICVIVFLWALKQFLHYKLNVLDARFIPLLTAYFRTQIVEKILFYHEKRPDNPKVGELLSKIIRLPALIRDIFHQIRHPILPNALILLFGTGYMFYINKKLGALMLLGVMSFCLVARSYFLGVVDEIKRVHTLYDDVHEEIDDVLTNTSNIFAAGMVQKELERISDSQVSYGKLLQQGLVDTAKFKFVFNATYFGMFLSVGYYTLYLYKTGKITVANATSVLLVLLFCLMGLNDISNTMRDFTFNIAGLMEMQTYLDEIFVDENGETLESPSEEKVDFLSDITFNHISVKVGEKLVYDDFSAQIPGKKLTGVIGSVGKGKSTLLKTLLRMIPLLTGNIYIGNTNMNNITTQTLRTHISYVPQSIVLFNRTVFENITYGNQNVTRRQVESMLQQFGITEISSKDFDRQAGKGGCNLSGGQKQIILVLRSLLKGTPILLLDEPTSALSTQSRQTFFNLLRQINDGTRTIIISTHDEELMRTCDNILEI